MNAFLLSSSTFFLVAQGQAILPENPTTSDRKPTENVGGLLVIVGFTMSSQDDAGTNHPVTFRFYTSTWNFDEPMFSADLGEFPGESGAKYEYLFPNLVANGSDAERKRKGIEGLDVAFGELCVGMDSNSESDDALIISRRDTFAWVGDVEFVSSCASPYMQLRVEPGECERFPLLPTTSDLSSPPKPFPTAVPSPTSSSSPTRPPTKISSTNCGGESCADPTHCRSQWGFCGTGPAYCHDASTWIPSCSGSPPAPSSAPPASRPTTAPVPSAPTQSKQSSTSCGGKSCAEPTHCRNQWGFCGTGPAYCHDASTWIPSCSGSPPAPSSAPSASRPTTALVPSAAPPSKQPSPTSQPTFPTVPGGDDAGTVVQRLSIGAMIRSTMGQLGQRFETSVLLYETPSLQWTPSTVYRFKDMMAALENMWTVGIGSQFLYTGEPNAPAEKNLRYALVNIAAFLSQSMQETIRYNACDENSWDLVGPANKYPVSNSCGQLGQSYQDYQCRAEEAHMQCEVDPNLELRATTHAQWYGAPAPLYCGPKSKYPYAGFWDYSWSLPWNYAGELEYEGQRAGRFDNSAPYANSAGRTDVEGCCYWGRGVIQTTGVCNFGKLNYFLGQRAALEGRNALYPDINFCKRPDLICGPESGHPELKWVAGLFYWMESVQQYNIGGWSYLANLRDFVDRGMPNPGDDAGFIHSVSGIVNRGCHNPPCASGDLHAGRERAQNFKKVLEALDLV